jgi:hypothetical protein
MNDETEMAKYESQAEAAYASMYEAAPHDVKDLYEDACLHLAKAIHVAERVGLKDEAERLKRRTVEIEAVYNHQFRFVGR